MNLSGLRQAIVGVGSQWERGPEQLITLGMGQVAFFLVPHVKENTNDPHGRELTERMKE